jgi:hypothetical protein
MMMAILLHEHTSHYTGELVDAFVDPASTLITRHPITRHASRSASRVVTRHKPSHTWVGAYKVVQHHQRAFLVRPVRVVHFLAGHELIEAVAEGPVPEVMAQPSHLAVVVVVAIVMDGWK